MVAAATSQFVAIEALMENGADPNAQNDEGTTALDQAWNNKGVQRVLQDTAARFGAGTTGVGRLRTHTRIWQCAIQRRAESWVFDENAGGSKTFGAHTGLPPAGNTLRGKTSRGACLEFARGVSRGNFPRELPAGGFPQELPVPICRVYIRIALTSVSESGLTLYYKFVLCNTMYFCITGHLCNNRHLRLYYKSILLYHQSFIV